MNTSKLLYTTLFLLGTGTAFPLSVTVLVQQHSYCGRPSGWITALPSGGVPPYSFLWNDGSTVQSRPGLDAAIYSVIVTDSQLDQATDQGEVLLLSSYDYTLSTSSVMMYCPGDPIQVVVYTGMDAPGVQPPAEGIYGANPYFFDSPELTEMHDASSCQNNFSTVWRVLLFDNQPGTVTYTDADGCPGQLTFSDLALPMSFPVLQVLDVEPSCPNVGTGSITYSEQPQQPTGMYVIKWRADADPTTCGNLTGGTGTVHTIPDLPAGDYWLIMSNDVLNLDEGNLFLSQYECKDSILVTVPAYSNDCGTVTGRLYIDENADCISAGNENRIPESIIEITPGPQYVTTSASGQYTVHLPFGTYSLAEQNPTYVQSCPADVTVSAGNTQTVNVGCAGGVPMDAQVNMANGPARPGFEIHYAVAVDNLTSGSPGIVTLTMDFDPNLTYVNAFPTPTSVTGSTLTWTAPVFNLSTVFAHRNVYAHFLIPSDVGLIGTTLNTSVTLATENPDANLSNNTFSSAQLVTGSFDPNDKVATTSSAASSSQYFIDNDEWIDYTIRFQNTGNDTAFNVIITDTLPSTLNPSSIQWGASSHTGTRTLSGSGLLKFIFTDIMLPDSNVNEAASHGFVSFRIKPTEPLVPGTVIENTANIYFDFNEPVITEPSVLVAEFSTGVNVQEQEGTVIWPNPVQETLTMRTPAGTNQTISIVALDGRRLEVNMERSQQVVKIDVRSLASGVYFLHAPNGTGRFIKN